MQDRAYYREQAKRARRLATDVANVAVAEMLRRLADDFDDIATDLQNGAVEINHPSRMPQKQA